jgi:hypothetical protein
MISTARERMHATSILQDELDRERSSRLQLQTQHEILATEIALARRDLPKQTLKTSLLEQDNVINNILYLKLYLKYHV